MTTTSLEPPNPESKPTHYLVGQDSRGHWIVQDTRGLGGGLFVSQREAMRYALLESGNHREKIIVAAGPIELDMTTLKKAA
jgi:hypothetical protein